MATLNMNDQMTALELTKRQNAPDPFHIIELMRETNEMLVDVPAFEANNGTRNMAIQRSIKKIGEHRIYNSGVGKVATQTTKIEDRIAMMEAYAEVDASMVKHTGNIEQARRSEYIAIVKGMGLTQGETMIFGDGKKDEEFDGLMVRRNKIDDITTFDAGGRSNDNDMTSLYLCSIGREMFHFIYPKGAKNIGIERIDNGLITIQDPNDAEKKYRVYQDWFSVEYGIAVIIPESVIRIANITKNMSGDALVEKIIEISYKVPKGASTYAMYSNDSILYKIDKAAGNKGNVVHTREDPWGKPITHIRNFRCRQMDVLAYTEDRVM